MHKTLIGFYRLFTGGKRYSVGRDAYYSNWPSDPNNIGLVRAAVIYAIYIVASMFFYAAYWYSGDVSRSICIVSLFLFWSLLIVPCSANGILQFPILCILLSPIVLIELFVKGNAKTCIRFANKIIEKTCSYGFGWIMMFVANAVTLLFFNPNEFKLQDTFNVCSMPKAALSKICNLSFKAKVPWESIKDRSREETIKRYDTLVSEWM